MTVYVCEEHLTKGLTILEIPHAKKFADQQEISCNFCRQKAKLKLFVPHNC